MKAVSYFAVLGISLLLSFVVVFICFLISERYFFDKVFYRKSSIFGYWTTNQSLLQADNSFLVERRIRDLRLVFFDPVSRGDLYHKEKKTVTIAVIGDSISYGMGVRFSQAFPQILNKMLQKQFPDLEFVLISLSQPGDDVVDNYNKYLAAEKTVEPDLYIFTLVDNDLALNLGDWTPEKHRLLLELKKKCPQPDFGYANIIDRWPENDADLFPLLYYPSFSPSYSPYCMLHQIAKKIPPEKSLFISVTSFMEQEKMKECSLNHGWMHSSVMTSYIQAFEQYGHHVLQVSNDPSFQYQPVSTHEGHPSAATHEQYAKILFPDVKSIIEKLRVN